MRYLTALVLTLTAAGAAGAADIYCNNQGRDCSDRPSPGAVAVHVSNPRVTNEAPPSPTISDHSATDPAVTAPADERLAREANSRAVKKDLDTTRAEQCKQAQDKYQKSIEARRIYRTGKDGEREYLTDAEADQLRMNARLEVTQSCGKSGG